MQGTCTTLTVDTPPPLPPPHEHPSQIVLKEFRNILLYQYFIWIYRRINILSVVKILLILIVFPFWNIYIILYFYKKKFIHHFRYYKFVLLFSSQLQHNLCFESIAILHVSVFSPIPKIIPYVLIRPPGWLKALVFSNPLPISDSIHSTPRRGMISLNTAWSGQSARSQHWMCVLPKRRSPHQTFVLIFHCFFFILLL